MAVGWELFVSTRAALIDGTRTPVISHPMQTLAREILTTMIKVKEIGPQDGAQRVALSSDLYTPENL